VREIRTAISRLKADLIPLALVALAGCGCTSSSTATQSRDSAGDKQAHAFDPPPVTADCATSLRVAEGQVGIPELRAKPRVARLWRWYFTPCH